MFRDAQVLMSYRVEVANQGERGLVCVVQALAADLAVQGGDLRGGFLPAARRRLRRANACRAKQAG